jgi:hypothetical protein
MAWLCLSTSAFRRSLARQRDAPLPLAIRFVKSFALPRRFIIWNPLRDRQKPCNYPCLVPCRRTERHVPRFWDDAHSRNPYIRRKDKGPLAWTMLERSDTYSEQSIPK